MHACAHLSDAALTHHQAAEDMTLTWEVASESLLQVSDRLRITLRHRQEGRRDQRGPSCSSLHRGTKLGEVGPLFPVFVVECDSLEALEPLGELSISDS